MATSQGDIVNGHKTEGLFDTVEHAEAATPPKLSEAEDTVDEDPHIAAAASGSDQSLFSLTPITFVAVFFLGLSVVGPISCGQLMASSVLTSIATDLGDAANISWVISGWAIASAVSFAIAGRLSDIFGRRHILLFGQLMAVIGSVVAATAQSTPALIAGSTLLGFAIGFILIIFAAVPELFPYKYRGIGLAWIEVCLFIPWGAFAVLLANVLLEHATWRWNYYIAIIYAAISLLGTASFYFPPAKGRKMQGRSKWEAFRSLDFIGIGLFASGLTLSLLGLAWGGTAGHPWKSASVLVPLILGLVLLIACFIYDFRFVADDRAFFPWHLFRRFRQFTVLLIVSFVAGMIYYPNAGLLPEATLYLYTNDPIQIGITLLPNGMGQLFGSTVIPSLLHIFKVPKFFIVAAVLLQTIFVGLYAYALTDRKGAWMAFQFFGQGCFDWVTTCSIVNVSLHVLQSDLGVAVGMLGTFRSFGGSVGNAIFQSILSNTLDSELAQHISAAALTNGYPKANLPELVAAVLKSAVGVPNAFANVPGVSPTIEAATHAALRSVYAHAFRLVFYSTIPFGVIALVAALCISDAGKYMTNHVSVRLGKGLGHK